MFIPGWFLKSLHIIDPTWRVEFDPSDGTYLIVKDVSVRVPLDDGGFAVVHGPRIVSVCDGELSESHLDELRARKKLGERMKIIENPANELKYYANLNKEAKEKKRELAVEMMAEGFMKMHKLEHSSTFVMPGEKKWPTTSPRTPDSGALIQSQKSRPQETECASAESTSKEPLSITSAPSENMLQTEAQSSKSSE